MMASRWASKDPDGFRDVHERTVQASLASQAELLEELADPDGPWPSDRWWPLELNSSLATGSRGGHGPVRYTVSTHEQGRSVRFVLSERMPFTGWHRFDLIEVADGVMWRHTLVVQDTLTVRAVALPLHDALLEDLLDTVAARANGSAEASGHPRRRPLTIAQRMQRAVAERLSRRPLPGQE